MHRPALEADVDRRSEGVAADVRKIVAESSATIPCEAVQRLVQAAGRGSRSKLDDDATALCAQLVDRRVAELRGDRDQIVRARCVAALAALDVATDERGNRQILFGQLWALG